MGHELQCPPQQRQRTRGRRVVLDVGVPGQRTNPNAIAVDADIGQLVQPVDVDDVTRGRQAHRQQRHQTLPARQHLSVRAERVE
jgi:hypothetical protein